ncbi:MAG: hypothetical protein J0I98_04095 [Mesorhizobium sp.]|nr:hypothetical protein [Mesorhizobium sp.]MBN9241955.1 hypothetical protein [Mesorhizobium sp.]
MALFGARATKPFRTRDPRRDRETDAARAGRLRAFLDEMRLEIEHERDGLRGRYESVTARAAFSQQALDHDEAGPDMASSVDELTRTMIDYTRRLDALEAQAAFVNELCERAAPFPQQTEEVAAPAAVSAQPSA